MNLVINEAKKFIDELNIIIPVDLNKICKILDIEVVVTYLNDAYGYLFVGRGKKIIFINEIIANTEKERFTIAHELGHYILGHNMTAFCKYTELDYKSKNIASKKEQEADSFASELLMPSRYINEELECIAPKEYDKIVLLKDKYKVSMISLFCKYVDVSYESLGLIYFKNGKELWKYQNFENCKYNINSNCFMNINTSKIIYKKDSMDKWINEENVDTYELIIPQGEYTIVLLQFIDRDTYIL
jgi:Zn-dependent peptidase ImmA (M78 family)